MSQKRILISTIGSRGEVQPALGLALALRALGHLPVLCVPPTFKEWTESFGLQHVSLGPDMKRFMTAYAPTKKTKPPSKQVMRQMIRTSIVEQFQVTAEAAQGCDIILTAGDLQHAGKSIAALLNIPHVHATYCPVTLRSSQHTPPNLGKFIRSQRLSGPISRMLWKWSDVHWNSLYRDTLNEQRAVLKQPRIQNVPRYIANEHSWVATDPLLAPAATFDSKHLFQTGAWMLHDDRPLPNELETFLARGIPPIYFGFGSMRPAEQTARIAIESARELGHRALISRGWGNLNAIDEREDCFVVGDVSHEQLFPRTCAIVHHGGAGTSNTATASGIPQVIVPHMYDQFYFADRVQQLRIGASAGNVKKLTHEKLTSALRTTLNPETVANAARISKQIVRNGAQVAAQRLVALAS